MRTILLASVLFAAGAGCGQETDDRELTAEYLVPAIFRPSCGNAACHSSATGRKGIVLDTVEGVCQASRLSDQGPLTQYMTAFARNRMPLDAPLPDADIRLLNFWYYVDGDVEGALNEPPAGCP